MHPLRPLALALLATALVLPGALGTALVPGDPGADGHAGEPLAPVQDHLPTGACAPPTPAANTACVDLPFVVDEHGDTMTGPLTMKAKVHFPHGHGIDFYQQNLRGDGQYLRLDGLAMCTQAPAHAECGDITRVRAGYGLSGGADSGSATLGVDINEVCTRRSPSEVCGGGRPWRVGGNSEALAGEVLGPTESSHFDLVAGGWRVARIQAGANLIVNPASNSASHSASSVLAGRDNRAWEQSAVVAGGDDNHATGYRSGILAGASNRVAAEQSLVGAGEHNHVLRANSAIAAGQSNRITEYGGFIGAGSHNVVAAQSAAVVAGGGNQALANDAFVGGGVGNVAGATLSVVPGGYQNQANGLFSFAAGKRARANHEGAFVWASSSEEVFASQAMNEFAVRAHGGARFQTSSEGTGAVLPAGSGSWASLSDRASKFALEPVDGPAVLRGVLALPLHEWSYLGQGEGVRHLGPMAQDFHAAFGLGEGPTTISAVDADGIALAAVQGLWKELLERDARIALLEERLAALER
jgi:hypothetical protein